MSDLQSLAIAWSCAKLEESQAVAKRREIEDKMTALLAINEQEEATTTAKTPQYQIKISTRLTRKVDADLIQELAAEHGLSHLLPSVCRWKPELDMRIWKGLADDARSKLSKAITTTAGRPSYSITAIETEE